jgi:hypothetical protein
MPTLIGPVSGAVATGAAGFAGSIAAGLGSSVLLQPLAPASDTLNVIAAKETRIGIPPMEQKTSFL